MGADTDSFVKVRRRLRRIFIRSSYRLQARRDSNPQPPVLETGALPIELRTYSMARDGIEPPTPRFSVVCSTN